MSAAANRQKKAPVKSLSVAPESTNMKTRDYEMRTRKREEDRPRRKRGKSKDWAVQEFPDDDDLEFEFFDLK